MSSPNLIPEQRADKNGNVVTRWVKNLFSGKETTKTIPAPVASATSTVDVATREATARWKSAVLPLDDMPDYYLPNWVDQAISSKDTVKLELVEKYGEKYDPELINAVHNALRNREDGEADHLVTERVLDAMKVMELYFPRKVVNPMDEEEFLPMMREEALRDYVLSNPESAHKVEELIRRKVYDPTTILETLQDSQNSSVATPLNGGLL